MASYGNAVNLKKSAAAVVNDYAQIGQQIVQASLLAWEAQTDTNYVFNIVYEKLANTVRILFERNIENFDPYVINSQVVGSCFCLAQNILSRRQYIQKTQIGLTSPFRQPKQYLTPTALELSKKTFLGQKFNLILKMEDVFLTPIFRMCEKEVGPFAMLNLMSVNLYEVVAYLETFMKFDDETTEQFSMVNFV